MNKIKTLSYSYKIKTLAYSYGFGLLYMALLLIFQGCVREDGIEFGLPVVTTLSVSDISNKSAIAGGNVFSDGGTPILSRGLCWSTNPNPTIADLNLNVEEGTGIFSGEISGLKGNTTYYLKAYAANSVGVAYGQEVEFTTNSANIYLVGGRYKNEQYVPAFFKNGSMTIHENESGFFTGVYINNSDVHMVSENYQYGAEASTTVSKYWENDHVKSTISGTNPFAKSIFVTTQNDLLVSGFQGIPIPNLPHLFTFQAVYWKNNVMYELAPEEFSASMAFDALPIGNDDYVVGFIQEEHGKKRVATLWKNAIPQYLTDGTKHAGAQSIYEEGGNIYVAGFEGESIWTPQAVYWKRPASLMSSPAFVGPTS
jgi:hypothetical protein